MSLEANAIFGAISIGIGATLVMDLWNLLLKRTFGISSLNYCLLGRWLCHMAGGAFRHTSITAAAPKPHECMVGWMAHYTIGVVFALVFVMFTSGDSLVRPTPLPALLYGIGTVVFSVLHHAAVVRSRHCCIKNTKSNAGQAEEPGDTHRIWSWAVCMCTWRELRTAGCCLTAACSRRSTAARLMLGISLELKYV
jgi:hypothetical protein